MKVSGIEVDEKLIEGVLKYRDEIGGIPNQEEWGNWNALSDSGYPSVPRGLEWDDFIVKLVQENNSDDWFRIVNDFLDDAVTMHLSWRIGDYRQWLEDTKDFPEQYPDGRLYEIMYGGWFRFVKSLARP